jgi:hypothetical protein
MGRKPLLLVLLVVATGLAATPAGAAIVTTSDAGTLGTAMMADTSNLAGAAFVNVPGGTPHAVSDTPLTRFPTRGSTYAILTTGDAALADDPNGSDSSGVDLGGPNVRGNTDYDVSVLRLDLNVPAGRNCLMLDFRFLSEEHPEYVGSIYNDGFVAELNQSTWSTSGSVISAPANFAFDPSGRVISINSTGVADMTSAEAAGTTYDGATPLLSAARAISNADANGIFPGNNSLFLSIFDQGDHVWDSAIFLDNLRLVTVTNPAAQCIPGARGATALAATPVYLEALPRTNVYAPNLSARLTDGAGLPMPGRVIEFYADTFGALTGIRGPICIVPTDANGVASCSSTLVLVAATINLGYTVIFGGDADWVPAIASTRLVRVNGQDLP